MTEILFISYHFPPEGNTAVQRSVRFVRALPDEGFLPIVIAGPAPGSTPQPSTDPGRLAKIPPNVRVFRAGGDRRQMTNKWRGRAERWLGLESMFSRTWIPAAVECACRERRGAQLVYATMSPFESAFAASVVSARLQIPWVADLRDPWALDDFTIYPTLLHRMLSQRRMRTVLSTAARIIMNTPEASKAVESAFPTFREKILTIPNGFDEDDFREVVCERRDEKFRIVHSGGFATEAGLRLKSRPIHRWLGGAMPGVDLLARSPLFLFRAITEWLAKRPSAAEYLELLFVGRHSREDISLVGQSGCERWVRMLGSVPHSKSLELIRSADVLFLPMHSLPPGQRALTVQAKVYEYIASGRTILAAVPDGDARDILSRCGTALISRPEDVSEMARHLDTCFEAWRNRSSLTKSDPAFVATFEGRGLTRQLAKAFRTVLSDTAQSQIMEMRAKT
jgi:glycosyltransferase involved in cell wall biosynthesis